MLPGAHPLVPSEGFVSRRPQPGLAQRAQDRPLPGIATMSDHSSGVLPTGEPVMFGNGPEVVAPPQQVEPAPTPPEHGPMVIPTSEADTSLLSFGESTVKAGSFNRRWSAALQ